METQYDDYLFSDNLFIISSTENKKVIGFADSLLRVGVQEKSFAPYKEIVIFTKDVKSMNEMFGKYAKDNVMLCEWDQYREISYTIYNKRCLRDRVPETETLLTFKELGDISNLNMKFQLAVVDDCDIPFLEGNKELIIELLTSRKMIFNIKTRNNDELSWFEANFSDYEWFLVC
jgi:hypothetical protein